MAMRRGRILPGPGPPRVLRRALAAVLAALPVAAPTVAQAPDDGLPLSGQPGHGRGPLRSRRPHGGRAGPLARGGARR